MKTVGFHRQFRFGFTLIELLVVIGIIGILASMLLPALGRAKQQTYVPVCQNNQRQMGLAMRFYSEELGRWVQDHPGGAAYLLQPNTAMPGARWRQDFNGSGTYVGPFQTWMDLIYPYIPNLTIFACAAVRQDAGGQGYITQNYGYNGYLGGRMTGTGRGFIDINGEGGYTPEKVMVTADYNLIWAYYMNPGDWGAQAQNPLVQPAWKYTAVYRHKDRSGVAMADGHVEFAEATDTTYYGVPGVNGRFHPMLVR